MPHYYIWTIGCPKNIAESERLSIFFGYRGYQVAATTEQADIVVLNSCAVRHSVGSPAIKKLNALKSLKKSNPSLILAVTGCLANSNVEKLKEEFPQVDYFFRPGESPPWLEKAERTKTLPQRPPTNVYVPILQGCDNFCSFCSVPFGRGRARSRPLAEISDEVSELVRRGTREVTLLVQNTDSYGYDLPGKPDLTDLLDELNTIDGLARLNSLNCSGRIPCPAIISGL